MADSIIKLKVDSEEYQSKIKRAAQALQTFGQDLHNAGKTFADADKEAVKFASELGKMQTVSNTARGRISELSTAFVNLKSDYLKMTDAEKQSPIGQAMAKSLEQLKTRTLDAKRELESLNKELELTNSRASGSGAMNQLLGGVAGKFGMSASMFTGVGAAVAGVGAAYKAISDNISTAMGFEKSMSQLSSLTGMVGKDLEQLKEYAIELGSTSTLTASQVADAFRLIGSQQPQLLASGEALKEVTKYAITLSEAAGIDLVTAAQTLSTSINQMGGDSNNAARYVNVLAAASQKGAGDIAWLGEALTKSATAAKAVGTDYEELVANLEQLAKAGFDASTAGTALRSIIMNLEKQANNDFKPSIVGLTQAFENLGKANLDIVGYQEMVGKMFASQAMALANAAQEAKNMTVAITGTNTATEQAATNTTNLDGSLKALASAWEGLNLHINSSNGLLKDSVDWLKDVVVWVDKAISGLNRYAQRKAELNNENAGKGNTRIDRQINTLQNTPENRRAEVMSLQIQKYWRYINEKEKEIQQTQNIKDVFAWETISKNNKLEDLTKSRDAAKAMLSEYEKRAKALIPSGKSGGGNNVTIPVEVETEDAKQSIKELQARIKELRKLRDEAIDNRDFESRDDYNKQIKEIEAKIKVMRGGSVNTTTTKTEQTETQKLETANKKLTEEYQKLATAAKTADEAQKSGFTERMTSIRTEIKANQDRIDELKKFADEAKNIDIKEGSLPALNKQLKELQENQSKSADMHEWKQWQTQIDEVTRKIAILKGELPKGEQATFTLQVNDEQLKQLRDGGLFGDKSIRVNVEKDKDYTLTVAADTTDAMKKVNELVKDIEHEQPVITPTVKMPTSLETIRQQVQLEMNAENIKIDTQALNTILRDSIKNNINIGGLLDDAQLKISANVDVENSVWQGILDQYNDLREQIGLKPIKIDFQTGKMEGVISDVDKLKKTIGTTAQVVGTIGQAFNAIEDPAAKVAATVAQAIANIALAYSDALAKDTTSKFNIYSFLAASAASIISMGSAIAQIHASTGYANGGIVKGNSYSGDNIPAMVGGPSGELVGLNAGEVVLNRAQQNTLAGELQGNNMGNLRLTAKLEGTDLLLSVERTLQKQGYGKIATWG